MKVSFVSTMLGDVNDSSFREVHIPVFAQCRDKLSRCARGILKDACACVLYTVAIGAIPGELFEFCESR